MADAYRGLTIRIGADVTGLAKALSASNKAISETQRQLSTLKRSMRFEGSGFDTLSQQMLVCADRARAIDKRVSTLSTQLKQIPQDQMQRLAKYTDAASTSANEARARYAKVCDEIKALKNQYASLAGYTDLAVDDPFKGVEGYAATVQKMRELASESDRAAAALSNVLIQYNELNKRYKDASAENALAQQAAGIQEVKVQLAAAEAEARSLYTEMARFKTANPLVSQTAEFQAFKGAMDSAERSTQELRSELERLDHAMEIDPSNTAVAEERFRAMAEQVRVNINLMAQLESQIESLEAAGVAKIASQFSDLRADTERAENSVADLTRQLSEAKNRLDSMKMSGVDEMSADFRRAEDAVNQLNAQLAEADAKLDQLGTVKLYSNLKSQMASVSAETNSMLTSMSTTQSRFEGMSGAFNQLGWSLYSTLTPAAMMFASSAISSAEDVDAAYRNMRKTVQGTEEQFEGLKQAAIDYSRTHFTSADQILQIEAMGGQLGVATDSLESFATVVSNLDIATDLDADTAATQLGQLSGILNDMTDRDFAKYGDALVRLGNNNATLESKISDVMLRIASMGTITGFTTPQLLAWSTAIAATGQGAESAGTAISNTMSDIEGAVSSGGDDLQAFADIAQMSADEFANAWNTDPSGAFYSFIEGLKTIEANGGSADQTLQSIGITGVRQKQALLGLMQTIDGLNANLQMSEDAWNGVSDKWGAAGDAAREADRKAEGFSGSIQLLRNNFQAFATEVGESMAPMIEGISEFVSNLTQAFSDLPDEGKQAIDALILLAAAAGPLIVAGGAVSKVVGGITRNLASAKSGWQNAVESGGELVSSLSEQAAAASGTSASVGTLSKSYDDMDRKQRLVAGGVGLLKGALTGLAVGAAAAGVAWLASELYNAYEDAKKFEQATDGLVDACDAMDSSIKGTADSVNGMSTEPARRELSELRDSIDETIEKQAELASEIEQKMGEANGNAYALETYVGIIEDLTEKYDENGNAITLNIEEQAKLQAAVDGVNGIMGTTYSVVDANNGILSASTDEIKRNTDAWILNAQAQAAQESMTDLLKERLQLQQNFNDAAEAYEPLKADYDAKVSAGWTPDMLAQTWADMDEEYDAYMKAKEALDSNTEAIDKLKSASESAYAEISANSLADALAKSAEGFGSIIEGVGISVDEFAANASQMGITIDDISAIGIDGFTNLANSCDGNINRMIFSILTYNATPFLDKDGNVTVDQGQLIDAQNNIYTWNGHTLLDKDSNVVVDYVELTDAYGNMLVWNGEELMSKEAYAEVYGNGVDGTAQQGVEDTTGAIDGIYSKDVSVNVNGNYATAAAAIRDAKSAIDKIYSKTVDVIVNQISKATASVGNASGGVTRHASGGVSLHADGAIATGPTMIGPNDVIGEDGAEAYVGLGSHNYIVPLTNKKYSSPFVSLLADGVSKRISSDYSPSRIASQLAKMQRDTEITVNIRQQSEGYGAVVAAIDRLERRIGDAGGNTTIVNGITYDDGSNIAQAVGEIVRGVKINRRR